ncbi:membrane protein insertase YidC [Tropicimonas sp. S265A]|uniref:membrane protein insertase YidC n=1 Tax=Tropicimonas sp. S265A TaxID=3415134 RepID=UPI003C7CF142
MDDQNKNLILATALSFLVILVWFLVFPPEEPVTDPNAPGQVSQTQTAPSVAVAPPAVVAPATPGAAPQAQADTAPAEVSTQAPRVVIDTPRVSGSISLQGGRIDDLSLKDYNETLDDNSPIVRLLSPVGQPNSYYALHGWAPAGDLTFDDVPNANTLWTLDSGTELTPDSPITLRWDNGNGLVFRRTISVDADYMFEIAQNVENTSDVTQRMQPYGIIARHGRPDTINFFVLHEGVVAMADGELIEADYGDMTDFDFVQAEGARTEVTQITENGWIGFTDKNWMTTLVPTPGQAFTSVSKYVDAADIYQTEIRLPTVEIAAGTSTGVSTRLFAGAKEWEAIRSYEQDLGIEGFIDSIDWGWFYFLTKPIFWVLHELNLLIGNMGVAIIALTLLIKAVLFPLAYKSYVSMARMKELQPEMEKIKERVGDDRQKMQMAMMELYKKEKVNPAAGCLPILLQIPIFFSLYKVIFVTIELRHAPFFGPFQDLSAPDPTSIFNLFGLFGWGAPEPGSIMALIFIGILPLLLGISMWLQQKLNPAPTDPTQAMIFAWLPWVFMFMLGTFASGLIVYWIANNVITFSQQYLIMRSHGYKPDVFGNIKAGFNKAKSTDSK